MTTWDVDTITKVSRLWIQLAVSEDVLQYARADVMEATRQRLAASLVYEAHTFGVDAHIDDVAFEERALPSEFGGGVIVRGWWAPATTVVEFVGGENDGRITEVIKIGDPWRVPRRSAPSLRADDPISLTIDYDEYELSGWRETERRWVYQVASR